MHGRIGAGKDQRDWDGVRRGIKTTDEEGKSTGGIRLKGLGLERNQTERGEAGKKERGRLRPVGWTPDGLY